METKEISYIDELKKLSEIYAMQCQHVARLEGIADAVKKNIQDTIKEIHRITEIIKQEAYEANRNKSIN